MGVSEEQHLLSASEECRAMTCSWVTYRGLIPSWIYCESVSRVWKTESLIQKGVHGVVHSSPVLMGAALDLILENHTCISLK